MEGLPPQKHGTPKKSGVGEPEAEGIWLVGDWRIKAIPAQFSRCSGQTTQEVAFLLGGDLHIQYVPPLLLGLSLT